MAVNAPVIIYILGKLILFANMRTFINDIVRHIPIIATYTYMTCSFAITENLLSGTFKFLIFIGFFISPFILVLLSEMNYIIYSGNLEKLRVLISDELIDRGYGFKLRENKSSVTFEISNEEDTNKMTLIDDKNKVIISTNSFYFSPLKRQLLMAIKANTPTMTKKRVNIIDLVSTIFNIGILVYWINFY